MKSEAEQIGTEVLTVKVYGMDEEGKPFFESASARRLTSQTALLEGMEHRPKSGVVLGVQYKTRKARAQVTWICEVNPNLQNQMGICLLVAQPCPWEEHLAVVPPPSENGLFSEKRRHPRYKLKIAIDLQQPDTNVRLQAQCTDISLSGCYVHTILPLNVATVLTAGIWIGSDRIKVTAMVRTCDRNVGMGIEFLNLDREQEARLQRFLTMSEATSVVQGRDQRCS